MTRPYPPVLTEDATLDAVLAGRSLARVSDGELKLASGRDVKAQVCTPFISGWLQRVAKGDPRGDGPCLVAIPNLFAHPMPPARANYVHTCLQPRMTALYGPGPYGSAFVSRPDCAPHIDTPAYWAKMRSIWAGRDVVLVWGADSTKGLQPHQLVAAASVEELRGKPVQGWDCFEDFFQRLKTEKRLVLLSYGTVATALAWRLAQEGVQAVDLGATGRFMRDSPHASFS